MKKISVILTTLLITVLLFVCSSGEEENKSENIYTEAQENLLITYIYDGSYIVSKNIYNKNTKITTEYTYFHTKGAWGDSVSDISIVTVTENGEIIDKS